MKKFFVVFSILCGTLLAQSGGPDDRYCQSDGKWVGITATVPAVFDGPASLPINCVLTSENQMQSPGGVVSVAPGASLQAAYNSAICGTTIKLSHIGTWTGPFNFSSKNCDQKHWITFITDGKITPLGVQINPSYSAQMPKIVLKGSQWIQFGDHTRFVGIEVIQKAGTGITYVFLNTRAANHITIERSYIHGNSGQEAQHGVITSGGRYIAIVDSWISDMHCIAVTGACSDAQAVSGGTGDATDGPIKIVNNHLEASGENILFGGGAATGCPHDLEIRRNHFFKPMSWNPGDKTYAGVKYITKNNFELKNACRTLIEGNIFENNWGGFSQLGYSVLFTPKNQNGQCPNCIVTDATFRLNTIHEASGAFVIGSGPSDSGAWSLGNHNLSIHDNIADGLQYGTTCYGCGEDLTEITSFYDPNHLPPPSEVLSNVSIVHNDIIAPFEAGGAHALVNIGGIPPKVSTPQVTNINFQNNIVEAEQWGTYTTGGGTNNCAEFWTPPVTPSKQWNACFVGTSPLTNDLIVGYPKACTDWPSGNTCVADWPNVGFVNFSSGDYHLPPTSPYLGMGANVDAVNFAIAGVR